MADAVTAKILRDGPTTAAFLFGNASDGSGESAIKKVDISALAMAATKVTITKLIWSCDGMQVKILFDHSTDDTVAILSGHGEICEDDEAPIQDPGSSGDTGDILFTTSGASSGDGYTIYMEVRKVA
jgi:uncharacterized cupin superfamily protein